MARMFVYVVGLVVAYQGQFGLWRVLIVDVCNAIRHVLHRSIHRTLFFMSLS